MSKKNGRHWGNQRTKVETQEGRDIKDEKKEKEEVKGGVEERAVMGEEKGWRDYLVNERKSCCDTP